MSEYSSDPAPNREEEESIDRSPPARRKKKGGALVGILVCAIVLAGLGASVWYAATHVIYAGSSIPKGTASVNMRSQPLTREEFSTLQQRLPDTEIRWNVPLSTGAEDSRTEELTLSALTEEDREMLEYFPNLKKVTFTRDFTDYAAAMALQAERPDLDVRWKVKLAGRHIANDAASLSVNNDSVTTWELLDALAWLPEVRTVTFTGGPTPYERMDAMARDYPEIEVRAFLEIEGKVYFNNAQTMSFVGRSDFTEENLRNIAKNAYRFPQLRSVDLRDCGFSDETMIALVEEMDMDVVWNTMVYGVPVCSTDTEIDVSRKEIYDHAAQIERIMPGMRHLEKVVMCGCGIPNEEMDELNHRYEGVRFVWTVYFSSYSLRTDATNFIAARTPNQYYLDSFQCRVLRYCTDLIALDLGHKELEELTFLYDLPKLQYLILVECPFGDITPIGSLKDLKYLEIFWTRVEDLTPLINCTKLQDLNICYIYARHDKAYEALVQMPWLERLWYCGNALTPEEVAGLKAVMPDCEMFLEERAESTGGGWRDHPHYFEMRDVFEMFYMPGGTNGVDDNGHQIVNPG